MNGSGLMILDWSVESEGKGTRTIQHPDEQIEGTRDGPMSGVDAFMSAVPSP